MKRFLGFCCLWVCLTLFWGSVSAQTATPDSSSIETYKQQCRQLVRFYQFVVNTIGDPKTSAREKDIIINQSYLKIFRDAEVQIEDDLEESRSTVTNKDVQAYLKDIDFFFQFVRFEFTIEEITHEVNEAGELYFLIRLNRVLEGLTVSNDSLVTLQERFMEVNLDPENRVLKIASFYTTKLSEKETLESWWNGLSLDWKQLFATSIRVNDSLTMQDVLALDTTLRLGDTLFLARSRIEGDSMRTDLAMLFESDTVLPPVDTILLNQEQTFQDLRQLLNRETLDLEPFPGLNELGPLSQMTRLRRLSIRGTQVRDLSPIRNLTRLEVLDCANTQVASLVPLQYATSLKSLIGHHTPISSLDPLANFQNLEELDLSFTPLAQIYALAGLNRLKELQLASTRVQDLSPLKKVPNLESLKLSGTPITQIAALAGKQKLTILYIDHTEVVDITPLSQVPNLRLLFCEASKVADLQALAQLSQLRKVYCDLTQVSKEGANQLMRTNPEVLVLYESALLQSWWQNLPQVWKNLFSQRMSWNEPPDREALHGLTNLRSINIADRSDIVSLEPLQQLTKLAELDCANSGVGNLSPLRDLVELRKLNLSGTVVSDLSPLEQLRNLTELDLSQTGVLSLEALANMNNLRTLRMEGTAIEKIELLSSLSQLERIFADQTELSIDAVKQLLDQRAGIVVVFRTEELTSWWTALEEPWKQVFRASLKLDDIPSPEQLHQLTTLEKVEGQGPELVSFQALNPFIRLKKIQFSNTRINDLGPLQRHISLEELEISRSPLVELAPLGRLVNLRILLIPNTPVEDLAPLAQLRNLEQLNCSGSQIRNLKPLASNMRLKKLDCSSTDINNIRHLADSKSMMQLICYNTGLNERKVADFKESNPTCEVVFY